MNVLVIGGTAEANKLCDALRDHGIPFLLSRAGALREMPHTPHPSRVGGFGGAGGLARFLQENAFSHLVLASHPYAERIAANAVQAATESGTPILAIRRSPWSPGECALWYEHDSLEKIAGALASGSRVFLSIGKKGLRAFEARPDIWFLWRAMETASPSLPGVEIIGGPSTSVEEEMQLLRTHRIDCLVSKNSGGSMGYAKVVAAERLGKSIHMLRRPTLPSCRETESVNEALRWLISSGQKTTHR